jgi:5'-3' exonuclease
LYGLGVPSIGEKTAKDISKAFGNDFAELWEYLKQQAGNNIITI